MNELYDAGTTRRMGRITVTAVILLFLAVTIIIAKIAIPAMAWYQLKVVTLSPISAR